MSVDAIVSEFRQSFLGKIKDGDRCVMLAALYNKVVDGTLTQERTKRPNRTRVIQDKLFSEFEIKGLPIWGATAVRGDLMDNKEHIRRFIDLVNGLTAAEAREAWQKIGRLWREISDRVHKPIELNPTGSIIQQLAELVERPSLGRIQQALCYAILEFTISGLRKGYSVRSKRTFAGDAQSGQAGDIEIFLDKEKLWAFEIKAHEVDQSKIDEVLNTHGAHLYGLVIVAASYALDISDTSRRNLVLLTLREFVASASVNAALVNGVPIEEAGRRILELYNRFVSEVERRPDFCVEIPA
jgi:hypothetical protein